MAKLTLTDISSGYNSTTTINANNALIEAALENTLSRDGSSPNTMSAALDMNSYNINNLPNATQNQQPVTLAQAASIAGVTNALSRENVGAVFYPETAAETSAAVTPTNYYYKPGDIRRYGASTAATAATNDTAIANALLANDLVIIPQDGDGSVYEISSSFTLGRFGQRVVGETNGNVISTESSDAGPRLDVVSGFPVVGGAAAQAVFNLSSRNQKLENISIDCNSIALHAVYATGGLITRCSLKNLLIQAPSGDGILFLDSTFVNTFENVVIGSPGGHGFNMDATSTSSGSTTVAMTNCYVTSAGDSGFRFDAVNGFTMDACACDSTADYAVELTGGACGTINGMDTEATEQLFDMNDNASNCLTVTGSRFLQVGNAGTPVANVINNGGRLTIANCKFQTDNGSTAYLVTQSGSETVWMGNSTALDSTTNTINASSYVRADNWIKTSNTSAAAERFQIRSTSTPTLEIYEEGAVNYSYQLANDAETFKLQRVNPSTKSVAASPLTLNGNDMVISTGSSGTMLIGGSGTDIGFYGATPVALQTGVAVTAAGIHAALVNLGLITA